MTLSISDFYNYYSNEEVKYASFLRVDNDTISLPSKPTFEEQKNNFIFNMTVEEVTVIQGLYTNRLYVKNIDDKSHLIAYKFEVTVLKKENIYLTPNGLMNGTKAIKIYARMVNKIQTFMKNEDYVIDLIFYPVSIGTGTTRYFSFNGLSPASIPSGFIDISYDPIQIRGTKELDFHCALIEEDLHLSLIHI